MLKTDRLTIRHIKASDWAAVRDIWEDQKLSQYAVFDRANETCDDAVKKRIAAWAAFSSGTEHIFFAVCLNDNVIGYVAFNICDEGYEIGYCFHSSYHKRGYAKESIAALLKHFSEMGCKKLVAGTALENTPSVSLLLSLGFLQTGIESVSFYKDASGNDIVFDGGIFELQL